MGQIGDRYNETEIYILIDGYSDEVYGIHALGAAHEVIDDEQGAALRVHAAFERLLRLGLVLLGTLEPVDEALQRQDRLRTDVPVVDFAPWPGGIEGMAARLRELRTMADADDKCEFWAVSTPAGLRVGRALVDEVDQ
ncbi:hypothetical protein [Rhodococcus rhodnii]|uniref:Uncharacterized protein n=1 Tax=Rhodococcus rhodnii LMG 5362 TaxID=1273125 RepID=R7WKJ1_9NOCA|nr:hypothetical protein [Rhodococcus rhodnii]EOM74554.1 hypothetical protein Rrhod_4143 [Rhodococcus rhodnii LMG 5362]